MEKRAVFNSSFRGSVEFQPSLTALFSAYLNPALHRLLRMIASVCAQYSAAGTELKDF